MENKKQFLDSLGLKHLWEKISYTFANKSETESSLKKLNTSLYNLEMSSITGAAYTDGSELYNYEVNDNQLIIRFDNEFVANSNSINALTHKAIAAKFGELENAITNIPKFNIQIVDELPTKDISSSAIYLLKNKEGYSNNLYSEYIYLQKNANEWVWEKLGERNINSGGLSKSEIEELINSAVKSSESEIIEFIEATTVKKDDLDDLVLTSINYGKIGDGMAIPEKVIKDILK